MTDYFALLDLPRHAAFERDEARIAFQKVGAEIHPDTSDGEKDRLSREAKFQQIQEAYSVLSSTPKRLKHLALLLSPESDARGGILDESLMQLFSAVNAALQKADALILKKQTAISALAKAVLAGEGLEIEEVLETQAAALMARQAVLHQKLTEWDDSIQKAISVLQNAAQEAAFLEKWEQQIQQRRLQLVD